HARAIISIENPDSQLFIFKKMINEDLSVRKVEELARQVIGGSKEMVAESTPAPSNSANKEIIQLQSRLSSHFGTKVKVNSDGKKGEIKIPFLSIEDLNRILDILKF
ncbi:MAG: chromosome partitioning protein ParB, partial [Bacteroidota bacterium]